MDLKISGNINSPRMLKQPYYRLFLEVEVDSEKTGVQIRDQSSQTRYREQVFSGF